MSPIALDVAAGIVLAFLPILCLTLAIHEKRNNRKGGAFVYGVISFILVVGLVAGGLDTTIWR